MKTQFASLTHKAPTVVRDKIFPLLDPHTQLIARKVCKSWKRLIDQIIPFRVLLNETTFNQVQKFVRTHKIGEFAVGYYSSTFPDPGNEWKFLPDALTILLDESQIHHQSVHPRSKKHSTTANKIELQLLSEAKLEKVFQEFKLVQKLTVDSRALALIKGGDSSFIRNLGFANLTCLNLFVEGNKGLPAIHDFLHLNYPQLVELSFGIKNDDDMHLYAELYSFLGRHRAIKTFKKTVVSCACLSPSIHFDRNNNSDNVEGCFLNFMQTDHRLGPVSYAEVLGSLGQIHLNHLDMQMLTSEGRARKNLELHLLRAQNTLTTLYLANIRKENMPVWRTVPALLRQCSATLKSVILDGCFCDCKVDRPGPFWCHWVEQCIHLERLEVLICGIKVVDVSVIPREHLKILCLGHMLTQRQMKTICENFLHLEQLFWPQLNTRADVFSRTHDENDVDSSLSRIVTIFQFKRACSLPKLEKLTLGSTSCKLKPVRKFAGPLMGVYENYLDNHSGKGVNGGATAAVCKRGDLEYTFDRKIFSYHLNKSLTKSKMKQQRSASKATSKQIQA